MRRRIERKIRKTIRREEHFWRGLSASLAHRERDGATLMDALVSLLLEAPVCFPDHRSTLADRLRATPGAGRLFVSLIQVALESTDGDVKIRCMGFCSGRQHVPACLELFNQVLASGSEWEQHRAVDAISSTVCRPVNRALIRVIKDKSIALSARDRAAEMLHLHGFLETVEACAVALHYPEVTIRFWAAYTLGNTFLSRELRLLAAAALQTALGDKEIAPGWWSVGREAQASLVGLRDIPGEREQLQDEIRRVFDDTEASDEDKRWAECYNLDWALLHQPGQKREVEAR
jgi:hypothetical protein